MWTGGTMVWLDPTRMDRWKAVSAILNPGGDDETKYYFQVKAL